MFIVKNRKIFYTLSIILVVVSIVALSVWGLTLGIDFKGGSSIEFQYSADKPALDAVKTQIDTLVFEPSIKGTYLLAPYGANGYVLNLRTITEGERTQLVSAITDTVANASSTAGTVEFKKFNSVGPALGKEAQTKSLISIILVLVCIVLFITFAFRKVSEPVSSWKYGIISIIGLCHNIIIPAGVFAVLAHYYPGYEVDTLFVTAILVILGFSIHDTIVVFDRVRENLRNSNASKNKKGFDEVVGQSISQTFVRSVNTSLTTLIAILVVYLIGPVATKNFALVLFIGIFFGTYSSIFIASPLLVTVDTWKNKQAVRK
ncbi:MAG: protein translocase subunit SecF [Candidatus Paceibacterota bacterium]